MEQLLHLFHQINGEMRNFVAVFREDDSIRMQISINRLTNHSALLVRILPLVGSALLPVFNDLKSLLDEILAQAPSQTPLHLTHQVSHEATPKLPTALPSSRGGRPGCVLPLEEVTALRQAGMSWSRIAFHYGVSTRTIHRKKWRVRDLPAISDTDLEAAIIYAKRENPDCGVVYIIGLVLGNGYSVTRARVREKLTILDPVGTMFRRRLKTKRQPYANEGPGDVMHMDGNEKCQPFGIYIHGAVDGFSRKVMYLFCSSNKRADTVVAAFERAVLDFGYPKKVRSDYGGENVDVARHMLHRFGLGKGKFITGKSVHNIRIERFWGEVNKITLRYRFIFRTLQSDGHYDFCSEVDRFSLYYVFLPRLQNSLDKFVVIWDCHKLRVPGRPTPNELFLSVPHPPPSIVINNEPLPRSFSGVDESEYPVFLNLARGFVHDPCQEDNNNGVYLYILLNNYLSQMQPQ